MECDKPLGCADCCERRDNSSDQLRATTLIRLATEAAVQNMTPAQVFAKAQVPSATRRTTMCSFPFEWLLARVSSSSLV